LAKIISKPVKNATTLFHGPQASYRQTDAAFGLEIPDLGAGTGLLDQQQEAQLGEMVLRQIGKEMPLYEDPWTQDELTRVFSRIYSASASVNATTTAAPIGLVIIEDNSINAFAVPGGLFALNTGLVLSVKTIDELAGVMGHEVAHVSQRHYSRSKEAWIKSAIGDINCLPFPFHWKLAQPTWKLFLSLGLFLADSFPGISILRFHCSNPIH
jgi:predicted Zn-dependent protease